MSDNDQMRLKIHVKAPEGTGEPPANRVQFALAYPGENVSWQLDGQGWAIGYEAYRAYTQGVTS